MRGFSCGLAIAALLAGCRSEPGSGAVAAKAASTVVVIWEPLGAWSGQKSLQTESFTSDTGAFRVKWEARAGKLPGEGRFLLTLHSAISGRPLQVVVDHSGPGAATAYLNDDPRIFFAVVDASNVEWSFTFEEAVGSLVVSKP